MKYFRPLAKPHLIVKIVLFDIFFAKFFGHISKYALKIWQKTYSKITNFSNQSEFCKRSIFTLIIIFISPVTLQGIENEISWRKAQDYFEAQDWDKAASIYEEILKQPLTSQERIIALINRGIIALALGNGEQALTFFSQVSLGKEPSPWIEQKLAFSYAYAILLQAQASLPSIENLEVFQEKLKKTITLLQSSISYIEKARETEIRLAEAQDREPNLEQIEFLQNMRKKMGFKIYQLKEEYLLKHLNEGERIALLINSLQSTHQELELLSIQPADFSERDLFIKEYLREQRTYSLHWDWLHHSFSEKKENESSEKRDLFFQAEKFYLCGIDYLKDSQLEKGKECFIEAEKLLKQIQKGEEEKEKGDEEESSQDHSEASPSRQESSPEENDQFPLLELIQQMESEDEPTPSTPPPPAKEGLRPW